MGHKSKTFNLSGLDGVYDVTIHKAKPANRKQRQACKMDKSIPKADSQQYDDARERMEAYGFDFNQALPRGFFD